MSPLYSLKVCNNEIRLNIEVLLFMAATGNEVVKLSQLKTIYDDLASKIGVGGMEFGTQDDIFEDGTNISAIGIKINGIAFVSFSY